jgi:hypothetical protein
MALLRILAGGAGVLQIGGVAVSPAVSTGRVSGVERPEFCVLMD